MMRKILLALALASLATPVWAVCPTPLTGKDGAGNPQNFGVTVDASGNCYGNVGIVDGTNAANKATVSAAGAVKVDASATTQPVSSATLSTAANQATEITALNSIATNTAAAIPAGANVIGFVSNDPCSQATKLGAPFSLTGSGQVITGTSAKKTYICSIDLISATAQNIALVEGTGSVCATNIFGLAGGTTAATGWNLPANGGLTKGAGSGTVYSPSADANGTAANVCLLLSSSGQTSGQITYVQQ